MRMDYLTQDGARRLVDEITATWRGRGVKVSCRIEEVIFARVDKGGVSHECAPLYVVRSDIASNPACIAWRATKNEPWVTKCLWPRGPVYTRKAA